MNNSSEVWPHGGADSMKTNNEALSLSWPQSRGEAESINTTYNALSSLGSRSNTTHSHILNPLLNGFLTGQLYALFGVVLARLNELVYSCDPNLNNNRFHDLKINNIKMTRLRFVCGATYFPASLGVFEILTKKLKTTNDGRPLSLYQEACCGLTAGTTAAFVWQPFKSASDRIAAHSLTYGNLFCTLHEIVKGGGFLALWKGSGLYRSQIMAGTMGLLPSYHRSLNYLVESKGLSKREAQLSASIVSGFFASVCSHPCGYLKVIKDVVKKKYDAGEKNAYRLTPLYIYKILTPYSGFRFYVAFLSSFRSWTAVCMVQWSMFELVRAAEEEYMDRSTPDCQP